MQAQYGLRYLAVLSRRRILLTSHHRDQAPIEGRDPILPGGRHARAETEVIAQLVIAMNISRDRHILLEDLLPTPDHLLACRRKGGVVRGRAGIVVDEGDPGAV